MSDQDMVVLLGDAGDEIGSAPKATVHSANTPLHSAFSCYLIDEEGRLLMTRRALTKKTWAGVWTNSFCGHPAPGETRESAIARRAAEELGASIFALRCILPTFSYRAQDAEGMVENEFCPVFVARLEGTIDPHPAEVVEWAWADTSDVIEAVARAPFAFSPWMREQLALAPLVHELSKAAA